MAEYYRAYDERYKAAYAAGVEYLCGAKQDPTVAAAIEKWITDKKMNGGAILEYGCGEGVNGESILRFGCRYWGVDFSLSALMRARRRLDTFPVARVYFAEMTRHEMAGKYEGILDCGAFDLLVTDDDRRKYLEKVHFALKQDGSLLFLNVLCNENAYSGAVQSIEEWDEIASFDYTKTEEVTVDGKTFESPVIPQRAKTKADLIAELEAAGFVVESFEIMGEANDGAGGKLASILAHKA